MTQLDLIAVVTRVRVLWAVQRLPVRSVATRLRLGRGKVARMVASGRPDVPEGAWAPTYAAIPWPPAALKAVQEDLAAGRRPGGRPLKSVGRDTPPNTWRLDAATVRCARILVAQGESHRSVARQLGVHQSTITRAVRGISHKDVPQGGAEVAALYERGVLEHQEQAEAVNTGTGRIQRMGPGGTVLGTYDTVRQAEVATGLDRMHIARALATGKGWRYEPGDGPAAPPPALWGDAADRTLSRVTRAHRAR